MTLSLEVVEDPASAAAAMMVSAALGGGEIVLAGGSTPKAAYGQFVRAVKEVGFDLTHTTFWIGDDRCVGPDDDLSNFNMIRASLLEPLREVTEPTINRIKGELGPEDAADDYERELRDAGSPKFDLVLLGIGPDGHTASLFPGQSSLSERSRLVVGVPEAGLEPFVPRVTLTVPALADARDVVFLVSGGSKADAVARVFGPGSKPSPQFPASLLVPEAEQITVLLDADAAAKLDPDAAESR
jgi:6-phosphogluconolactonase